MVNASLHGFRVVFEGVCHLEAIVKHMRVLRHIDIDFDVLKHLLLEGVREAPLGGDGTSCAHRHCSTGAQEFSLNNRSEAKHINAGLRFTIGVKLAAGILLSGVEAIVASVYFIGDTVPF